MKHQRFMRWCFFLYLFLHLRFDSMHFAKDALILIFSKRKMGYNKLKEGYE